MGVRTWPARRRFLRRYRAAAPARGSGRCRAKLGRSSSCRSPANGPRGRPPSPGTATRRVSPAGDRHLAGEPLHRRGAAPGGRRRDGSLLLEPVGRNTAPAAAVAAFHLARIEPGAILLVMPADHHIEDGAAFRGAVAEGASGAEAGHLVALGVAPGWPETGHGHIRRGRPLASGARFRIERFIEKPDLAAAKACAASGDFDWSAGIFLFRCDRYLEALARARPDIHAACEAAVEGAARDLDFLRLHRNAFLGCPAESIDTAVMETAGGAQVVPVDMGWSDIGSWNAVQEMGAPDESGNAVQGDGAPARLPSLLRSQRRETGRRGRCRGHDRGPDR